jgi:hypothetical protein
MEGRWLVWCVDSRSSAWVWSSIGDGRAVLDSFHDFARIRSGLYSRKSIAYFFFWLSLQVPVRRQAKSHGVVLKVMRTSIAPSRCPGQSSYVRCFPSGKPSESDLVRLHNSISAASYSTPCILDGFLNTSDIKCQPCISGVMLSATEHTFRRFSLQGWQAREARFLDLDATVESDTDSCPSASGAGRSSRNGAAIVWCQDFGV